MQVEETTASPVKLGTGVMAGPHRGAIFTLLAIFVFIAVVLVLAAWRNWTR